MTIGINTLFLIPNRVGGTEYYTRSFLKYLERLDKKNSYVVFCNKENFDTFHFESRKWKKVLCPIRSSNRIVRILYEQFIFPFVVTANKCNLLHSFGYFGPICGNFKKVVTIHDANWKDCPDDVSRLQVQVMNVLISLNVFVTDRIITDSDFSKGRLEYYYPKQRKKIAVVLGAIEDDFLEMLGGDDKPIIKGDYLLCVSKFYPHKKIPYLISLFKEIEKRNKRIKLVLVGQGGNEENEVTDRISGDSQIIHFKKVKFPDLVNIYKYARAFVFPSVYEGFGYPVFEALSAKIPVYVGNMDLYLEAVIKDLTELSFDIDIDSNLLLKADHKKPKGVLPLSYGKSARKLISIYDGIKDRN